MSTQDKVKINKLPTGVPGLDEIVGGGRNARSIVGSSKAIWVKRQRSN